MWGNQLVGVGVLREYKEKIKEIKQGQNIEGLEGSPQESGLDTLHPSEGARKAPVTRGFREACVEAADRRGGDWRARSAAQNEPSLAPAVSFCLSLQRLHKPSLSKQIRVQRF